MAGTDQWQTIVLLTLRDEPNKFKPGTNYQIRVIQKVKNGKTVCVKIQVGETYILAASGELRFKSGDISTYDIKTINEHMPKIESLQKNPPPVPVAAPADDIQF